MRRGVSPALLLEQTRNTAGWALDETSPGCLTSSARARLLDAPALEARWRQPEAHLDYLGLMLAAHYTTVATFVPTDVDSHIRYHIWQEIESVSALEAALLVLDEAAAWDVHAVSARVVMLPGWKTPGGLPPEVYGHAGEWFSVRAGALGRALALGADDAALRLRADIEREVIHEAEAFAFARVRDPLLALRVATTLAHNLGDLSRVIEAWPKETPGKAEYFSSYARLGHRASTGTLFDDQKRELELAGHVNKQVMAPDNHRYLALREPRVLRRSRDFILPLGPFFEGWAQKLVRSELDSRELGQVLTAMIHGTESTPGTTSYYRAMAEIHRVRPGGLEGLEAELPARYRKLLQKGAVRDALRMPAEQWDARLLKSFATAVKSYRPSTAT